jgi:hypothetical protein
MFTDVSEKLTASIIRAILSWPVTTHKDFQVSSQKPANGQHCATSIQYRFSQNYVLPNKISFKLMGVRERECHDFILVRFTQSCFCSKLMSAPWNYTQVPGNIPRAKIHVWPSPWKPTDTPLSLLPVFKSLKNFRFPFRRRCVWTPVNKAASGERSAHKALTRG